MGVTMPLTRNWDGEVWQNLLKHPVELGKTCKAAARRDIGNFMSVYSNSCWALAHPGNLDVVDEREPCHPAELVRQIVRTDEEFLRQIFQRKLAGVVPVDVAGHGVDLLGDGIAELLRLIAAFAHMLCHGGQKLQKMAVDELLRQRGHWLLAQCEDCVQVRECLSPRLAGKAVDGHLGPERL